MCKRKASRNVKSVKSVNIATTIIFVRRCILYSSFYPFSTSILLMSVSFNDFQQGRWSCWLTHSIRSQDKWQADPERWDCPRNVRNITNSIGWKFCFRTFLTSVKVFQNIYLKVTYFYIKKDFNFLLFKLYCINTS